MFAYELVLFNLTIVAFANEKDLGTDGSLFTLWFYAAGDTVGRLFSGQLSGELLTVFPEISPFNFSVESTTILLIGIL